MIPLEEARSHVLVRCPSPVTTEVELRRARGLVTAEPIFSTAAVPPFDNTAMDGYAVRSADTADPPVKLVVVGTLLAGRASEVIVGPGEALRIMTGAVIPVGADAVVMVESTSNSDNGATVTVEGTVAPGNHIRLAGEDLQIGDQVFAKGTILGPGHLGVLASIGCTQVPVFARPKVGVLSTGDELVDGSAELAPGQIRDTNRYALLSLLEELGVEPIDLGTVPDSERAIEEALLGGVATCDTVLTSGGVSMGDSDYVKVVLDRIGDMRWMQVAIKPGKPLAFGLVNGVPIFGLPGNPVSSMVSFELFARPALRAMMGCSDLDRPRVEAVTDGGFSRRPDGKTHFVRVAVTYSNGQYRVEPSEKQGSHQLTAMAEADGLAVVPDGDGSLGDDTVEVLLLR
ncbi:MAG: gephyrin-like molybdotransferase Glp [Actinomycetota bacterium]|nr:gephyrin-like molybdotransferase Glp [Actinomycetota bacterium]